MLLRQLLENVEIIEMSCDLDTEIQDLCYDSRKAVNGCLYAASSEFPADRHEFIADACAKGAAVVMCEKKPEIECPWILVKNTRTALARMSAAFYGNPARKLKIIGITGTNGKTTSATLLKNVLETLTGKKAGLIGTVHNMIGREIIKSEHTTPEARELHELLARMEEAGCEYVVMEVSSHSLALSRVEGIHFTVGAFTNLTHDHLDFHKDIQGYMEAKAKLFSVCDKSVINTDDPSAAFFVKSSHCPVVSCGVNSEAEIKAEEVELDESGVRFNVTQGGVKTTFTLAIPATFSVYNALTVIGCCHALGFVLGDVASALTACEGVKGRVEPVSTGGRDFTVLIDYAHTPDAIENVLKTVRSYAKGRVVILFGCGGDRDRTKRPEMARISAALADYIVVTSDNPRTEHPQAIINDILKGLKGFETPYTVIADRRSAIRWAIENALPKDIIILTGKGHEEYQIMGKTKYHMDEREIVAEVLRYMK